MVRKKFLKFFSSISIFSSRHVLVWWYVLKTISWVHFTRFQWQFGHIRGSELIFAQNVSELAFCLSKEKIELFFKNRKSISTWLRSMNRYYDLWIESTYFEDVSKLLLWYSIFKTFSFIFFGCKMRIMHDSLIKISQKYFFKFWM